MREYPKYFWVLPMDMQAKYVGGWWKISCMCKRYDILKYKLEELPNTAEGYDEEMMAGIAYVAEHCTHPNIKATYANIWRQVNEQRKK